MKIGVIADDNQWHELSGNANNFIHRVNEVSEIGDDIDAIILMKEGAVIAPGKQNKPILLNSVCTTLAELETTSNVVRFNGWNGFVQRQKWEVAGHLSEDILKVIAALGKEAIAVEDEKGFVSARIISMIVNEAYFALEEGVS